MKMQIPKKLRVEDFKSDQQDLVSKIAFVYNVFADEVYAILNGNVGTDNTNSQDVEIIVKMDASNMVINSPQIKTNGKGKVKGIIVLNAVNQVNPSTYPTTWPGINFTINGDILTILNITGLQASSEYKLTLRLVI